MKANRGFTLIEVMVVLSILAIIAILAYNFFGGTMREATLTQAITQIAKDMTTLNDAADKYYIEYGSKPGPFDVTFQNDLLSSGMIKAIPVPPPHTRRPIGSGEAYWVAPDYWDFTGDGVADDVIGLDVTVEACDAFNAKYTQWSAAWNYTDNANTSPVGAAIYCEVMNGASTYGTIYRTSFAN